MTVLDKFKLDDKVVIVTGAGRGLGRSMAISLAEAGADVAVMARSMDQLEETADEIEKLGRRALPLSVNITSKKVIENAVDQVVETLGRVDILVNNAGIAVVKPLVPLPGFDEELTEEELMGVLETNLIGPIFITQAVGRYFVEQRSGKVINISSVDGARGGAYKSSYACSKAGLLQFSNAMANEWARYKICVNTIVPGAFHTDMSKKVYEDEKLLKKMHSRIPMFRSGELDELGSSVVFLASDASDYVTGAVINVDGGYMVY